MIVSERQSALLPRRRRPLLSERGALAPESQPSRGKRLYGSLHRTPPAAFHASDRGDLLFQPGQKGSLTPGPATWLSPSTMPLALFQVIGVLLLLLRLQERNTS